LAERQITESGFQQRTHRRAATEVAGGNHVEKYSLTAENPSLETESLFGTAAARLSSQMSLSKSDEICES